LQLQGISIEHGNAVFIDPSDLKAYFDQWNFLANIKRNSISDLDTALSRLTNRPNDELGLTDPKQLVLTVGSGIGLPKSKLNKTTVNFIREELNFPNLDYWLKKRLGKSVYQTEKFFKLINEDSDKVILPRGFLTKLTDHLRSRSIPFVIKNEQASLSEVSFSSSIILRPNQAEVVDAAMLAEQGVIVAPAGSGKTLIGLELIARRKQPALIITHRKQIMDQWVDRIQTFLGLAKSNIGRIGGVKNTIGDKVTVAMMQSLVRKKDLSELANKFGLVIIDECHHIPAKTFREAVSALNPCYIYGLTATPERKHKDEKLIYLFIGDIIAELHECNDDEEKMTAKTETGSPDKKVIVRETALSIPFSFRPSS
jgi:hypothetical protein